MTELFETSFSWPALPASVLMLLCFAYWLMVMLGAMDIEMFDLDLDFEADGDVMSAGFVALKFLNIGDMPLMLWASIFSLSFWSSTMLIDLPILEAEAAPSDVLPVIARNLGIALVLTKLGTQPLRGRFVPTEPNRLEDLIGQTCVITTSEATAEFGQAEFNTEAAPLLLNVRTIDGSIAKGQLAEIVDMAAEKNIYLVKTVNGEPEDA